MVNGTKYDVFLSYNRADLSQVKRLADALGREGLNPWFDQYSWCNPHGHEFIDAIDEGLEASSACAVFFGSVDPGRWTQREIRIADILAQSDPSFRVIPVLLPDFPAALDFSALPLGLRGRNGVDLRGREWRVAVRDLTQALRAKEPSPPHHQPRERPAFDHKGASSMSGSSHSTHANGHGGVMPLTQMLPLLQEYVRDLTLTPVIGSGCSLVGRSEGQAWTEIADEMNRLLLALGDDELACRYLRALAAVPAYDIPLGGRDDLEPASDSDPIVRLQIVLTKLGAELGVLFAQSMLESATPVWDTISYRVRIPRDTNRLAIVAELLLQACEAAYHLRPTAEAHHTGHALGASGMFAHLIELTAELTEPDQLGDGRITPRSAEHPDLRQEILRDIRTKRRHAVVLGDRHEEELGLSAHQLEWIADALWHTFRYDKPAYPRTDELAFQVSLIGTSARGRRPEVSSAAEIARAVLSARTMSIWFHRFSGLPASRMLEFYDTWARTLRAEHNRYQARGRRSKRQPIEPLALSTTYDLEMEHALHRLDGLDAFHVIIPVHALRSDDSEPELEWLMGTVAKHDQTDSPSWEWIPRFKDTINPWDLSGPIVIKLNGSPLHHLPEPHRLKRTEMSDDMPDYEAFEHALVLSESQYLHSIVWQKALPQFVTSALQQENRVLFFLGHSTKEWSTRLRLYSHVHLHDTPKAVGKRIAVNRSHDPYRSEMLSTIGIDRWIGELAEIPPAVNNVLTEEELEAVR